MRNRKRQVTTFSLSFLDIMACGFGAVTLLFLILKHDVIARETADPNLRAEVNLLQEDIRAGEQDLVALRNSLAKLEENILDAQGLSARVVADIDETKRELSIQADSEDEIAILRKQVEELERETAELQQQGRENDVRTFVGQGDRQYLTGLKLGGRRVMILLDASASMLSESIVNVIRLRNLDKATQLKAEKWRRSVLTAEWIVANLPLQSTFQVYVFNSSALPVLPGTEGQWLDPSDTAVTDRLFAQLRKTVPQEGTNMLTAVNALSEFERAPDNLFLITDGLPTLGEKKPSKNTVTGRQRVNFFNEAVRALPRGLPVNVVLMPMEGDPQAAAAFWQLAIASNGAFISPARDWP